MTMNIEGQVREAIVEELQRQAETRASELKVQTGDEMLTVNGTVNLDELVMVIVGSLAGGP